MSIRHTPGPWASFTTYAHIEIRDASGKLVAVVGSGSGSAPTRTTAADARLIAAAPKLLAHLSFAVDVMSRIPALAGTAQVGAMRSIVGDFIGP